MTKEIRNCACCGLPFEALNKQQMYCHRPHYLPCPICGKPVLKSDRDFTRPPACCSKECTVEKNRRNLPIKKCVICGKEFKPKSGIALICEREHYGKCEICGKEMLITKRMWHDRITTCSRKCAKEKLRRFYQEKYGVDYPMQNSQVQEHFKAAMQEKYGVEHALQRKEFLDHAYQTNLERFGTMYACMRDECRSVSPMPLISSHNKSWGKLLENTGLTVEYEKKLSSRSFDLCIEDQKLVIEIDPTYTHNSLHNHWGSPLEKNYHKTKSDIAFENGYHCIHVFEWDAKEKILGILKPKTKVGARKCEVREVSSEMTNEFLNKYHLQGTVKKQKFRYGLFLDDELMQIMTFGNPRYDKKHDAELLRLCTKPGFSIMGGSKKLFKHAIDLHPEWRTIISYCDKAKFKGDVYSNLGMTLLRVTPPQEIWSKGSDKITAMLLRQRGYDQLFGTNYGKGTSNDQLMAENGWLPVYDCGQYVFLYERESK